MKKSVLRPLMLALAVMLPCTGAAAPAVYPTPQQSEFSGEYTQAREVRVETAGEEGLPCTAGAYAIHIAADGCVRVVARDAAGVFYAKQTLSQLLEGVEGAQDAQRDPFPDMDIAQVARLGKLPVGSVRDWPGIPNRGTVEGYYGRPWSHAERLSHFDFYGRNKLNTYIYAPKDDPYHRGEGAYKPYPEQQAAQIAELVERAHRNHVRFVWAIHPANTVRWNVEEGKTDMDGLCRKLQHMYDLGVRDFAVLVDDNEGEIIRPARQAQLCNYITEHFLRTHPDVTQELIMCPSHYCKYWAPGWFLRILGTGLDKSTHVMWTGDTVVHDINLPGQKWVHEHLGRPTFVWWNWPCNDFKRNRLAMGCAHGLDTAPEMTQEVTGFVANPMEQAEASKPGLFGVADYTWNPAAYLPEPAWKAGISRLYTPHAEAVQTFCNHAAFLQPGDDGFDHQESTGIAPAAARLREAYFAGTVDTAAVAELREEFRRIRESAEVLGGAPQLEALRKDVSLWVRAFALLGKVGGESLAALEAEPGEPRLTAFLDALETLMAMRSIPREHWMADGTTKTYTDVEVGAQVLHPIVVETLHAVGARVFHDLTGREHPRTTVRFSAKTGGADREYIYLQDGNEKTWWPNGCDQTAGDWYCFDFGKPVEIRTVTLILGAAEKTDYAVQGRLEYSDDGIKWLALGDPDYDCRILRDLTAEPLHARMLRYRVITPKHNWLAINEFGINRPLITGPEYPVQDADFLTYCDCKDGLSLTLRVPDGAKEAVVIGNAECTISGATGEAKHRLLRIFPLPSGAKEVQLQAPAAAHTRIQEVIFR